MAKTRNGVIAALDIGTTKVVCFIARVDGQGLRVVGIGHQPAQGMRSGNIVDMEAADARHLLGGVDGRGDVRRARARGHRRRERRLGRLAQSEPRGRDRPSRDRRARRAPRADRTSTCRPRRPTATSSIPSRSATRSTARRVRDRAACSASGWASTCTWSRRRAARCATCRSACAAPISRSPSAWWRAHASGLSSLVADERDLGVTVIDMGGGTTSIAVFFDGHLVHTDTHPGRRRARHQRHRPRPVDAARPCRADEDAVSAAPSPRPPTSAR